jgi:hypothetical protein
MSNEKNTAGVSISLDNIEEDGPPSAKVVFEIAGGSCGQRAVRGTYHYTAVYEDTRSGSQNRKLWSRSFDGVANPAFATIDYVSLASFERLVDAIDPDVDDSNCG